MEHLEIAHEFLRRISPIPVAAWKKIEHLFTVQSFSPEEYFVSEGQWSNQIAVVIEGLFRATYPTETGKNLVKGFYDVGSVISSYTAILQDKMSSLSIVAVEPSLIAMLRLADFNEISKQHACWGSLQQALVEQCLISREKRERELLTLDASERYEAFMLEHKSIASRISQIDIAAYLGITPVSLSRIRSRRSSDRN